MTQRLLAASLVGAAVASGLALHAASRPRATAIPQAHPFQPVRTPVVEPATPARPEPGRAPAPAQPAQTSETALPLLAVTLLGTFVADAPAESAALLQDGLTGARRSYRAGETIQGRVLTQIARGHVLFAAGRREERVDLAGGAVVDAAAAQEPGAQGAPPPSPWQPLVERIVGPGEGVSLERASAIKAAIRPVSPTERVVDRRSMLRALGANPFPVLREAEMQLALVEGRVVGVELTAVPEDGVLERSGFRSGDVVQGVNGEALSPAAVLQWAVTLPQADVIQVQIERDGAPVTLTYRVE